MPVAQLRTPGRPAGAAPGAQPPHLRAPPRVPARPPWKGTRRTAPEAAGSCRAALLAQQPFHQVGDGAVSTGAQHDVGRDQHRRVPVADPAATAVCWPDAWGTTPTTSTCSWPPGSAPRRRARGRGRRAPVTTTPPKSTTARGRRPRSAAPGPDARVVRAGRRSSRRSPTSSGAPITRPWMPCSHSSTPRSRVSTWQHGWCAGSSPRRRRAPRWWTSSTRATRSSRAWWRSCRQH